MSVAATAVGVMFIHLPFPASAVAQTNQLEMFQDDTRMLSQPGPTLATLRQLGVGVVRVSLQWSAVAPAARPQGFKADDPASYPASRWSIYDQVVLDAQEDGIAVDFSVSGGAPPVGRRRWPAGARPFRRMEAVRRGLSRVRKGGRHALQRQLRPDAG